MKKTPANDARDLLQHDVNMAQESLDEMRERYDNAKKALKKAQRDVEQAEVELDQINEQYENFCNAYDDESGENPRTNWK